MPDVAVRYQATPNPNAGKFTVNRKVVEGKASRSFYNAAQAEADPVAAALFALGGVTNVFMVDDFVTVTRDPAVEWSALIPRVTETLERLLS
ncbi:MAG TPA: NifU N-terminal domain-containing protein [Longimicrobiales bacterium]|nr:NifU N-terminal domain-containing protein [Longimicrobiales bacterium]